MEIKYPVKLNMATLHPAKSSRIELTFTQSNGRYERFVGNPDDGNLAFLDKLVADANNASTVQADYDRLEAKIDDMVEARVNTVLGHGWTKNQQLQKIRQLESDAFVDAKAREALRDSNNELTKYSAQLGIKANGLEEVVDSQVRNIEQLRKDNEALVGRVNGLLEERDSIVAANNSHYKELESLRKIVKLFKHTVGEQRQHLRRLRAKLVKRALLAGEERAKTAAWIAEAEKLQALYEKEQRHGIKLQRQLKDIRRYMHEQGWKLPAEPRPADATFLNLVKAAKSRGYKNPKDWALRRMGQVDHKDGDPKNNTPRNLAVEVRDRYKKERAEEKAALLGPVPFSDKMFEEAAQQRRKVVHADNAKFNDFYRELGELLTKSFGLPKYPFPKKGE